MRKSLLLLAIALMCAAPIAAQGRPDIYLQNAGTGIGHVFYGPLRLNCSTGMTCTWNEATKTFALTASGAGGTVTTTGTPANTYLAGFSGATSITGSNKATLDPVTGNVVLSGSITASSHICSGGVSSCQWVLFDSTGLNSITHTVPAALGASGTYTWPLPAAGIFADGGSGTINHRTLTGTANRIVITNGDGAAGNPTFDVGTSIPKVRYAFNCTTSATCNTEANATGTGGAQLTDDTSTVNQEWFDAQYTVPANFLTTNKILRVTVGLETITGAAPPNLTLKLYWGGVAGTVLMETTAAAPATSVTRAISYCFLIQGTAAAGASVNIEVSMCGTSTPVGAPLTGQPIPTVATNADKVLIVSGQWSANAANTHTIRLRQMLVEEIN